MNIGIAQINSKKKELMQILGMNTNNNTYEANNNHNNFNKKSKTRVSSVETSRIENFKEKENGNTEKIHKMQNKLEKLIDKEVILEKSSPVKKTKDEFKTIQAKKSINLKEMKCELDMDTLDKKQHYNNLDFLSYFNSPAMKKLNSSTIDIEEADHGSTIPINNFKTINHKRVKSEISESLPFKKENDKMITKIQINNKFLN
jgi:hypothetical protein